MIKTKIEKLEDQLEKIIKRGIPERFINDIKFITHKRVRKIEKLIDQKTAHTISFDVFYFDAFYEDIEGQPYSEVSTHHYTFDGEKYHESSSPKGVVFKIACGLS